MHIGTLNDYRFADQGNDIRGTNLYGINDEKLGTIHDVIFDHETGTIKYAIVDTGGWLRHKYFLVPAARIEPFSKHEDHFYANLDKQRIEMLPPYDAKVVENRERWTEYENRYRSAWSDDEGVLHAEGSARIVTPDPRDVAGGGATPTSLSSGVPGHQPDIWPERLQSPTAPPKAPQVNPIPEERTVTSVSESPQHRSRWSDFSTRLQRDLPSLRKRCATCSDESLRKVS